MILRRIEGSRFSEVQPLWAGVTTVILASGSSLTMQQVNFIEDARKRQLCRCIAVNDTYLVAPWADVVYFADAHWWKWHTDGISKPMLGLTAEQVREKFAGFAGKKCSIQDSADRIGDDAVHVLRNRDFPNRGNGLSLDPQQLVTGRNSGFQALNLAVLSGSKRIVLVGFDGGVSKEGKEHFHGGHPRATLQTAYPLYRQAMSSAESALIDHGVDVLNASPGSQIDSFHKVKLADVL